LLVVFAITDKRNGPLPPGLVPLVVFITILGIAVAFGMQTGMFFFSHITHTSLANHLCRICYQSCA
jgi:glycerol uptake facilitator-like aquaporin